MSKIPELLLEHAAGLRKEASAAMQDIEALGHCAVLLLEKAAEEKDIGIAERAIDLSYDFLLSKEASYGDGYSSSDSEDHLSRIESLEDQISSLHDRLKEMDGVNQALAHKVIKPSAGEIQTQREYLARGLAYKAQREAAYRTARTDRDANSNIVSRHPVASGMIAGSATGAAIGSKIGKAPGAAVGGMLGAVGGAIAGGIANAGRESRLLAKVPEYAEHPAAQAAHERVYSEASTDLDDAAVKKEIVNSTLYPHKYPSAKETMENARAPLRLYKAAAEQAVNELIARGLDPVIAEQALTLIEEGLS